jgi:hypothetical protein
VLRGYRDAISLFSSAAVSSCTSIPVATEAIPARAAHGGIDWRHATPIFRIQFRAPVGGELNQIVPAPECGSVERCLPAVVGNIHRGAGMESDVEIYG